MLQAKLRWIETVLRRMHWLSLLTGIAVGTPLWWTIRDAFGSSQMGPGLEVAVGVVLGALAGWVVPEFIQYVRRLITITRPLHQVVNELASNSEQTTIVMAALFPKDTSSFLKVTHENPGATLEVLPRRMLWVYVENDARALSYSLAVLSTAGKHQNLSIIRDDESLSLQSGHFICIGSPKANLKSKQLFDCHEELPVAFAWSNSSAFILRSNLSEDTWEATDSLDFGLILKVRTHESPVNYTMVLAGVSHVGTATAGWYLWRHWQMLAKDFGNLPFALVLRMTTPHYQHCAPVFKAIWAGDKEWQVTFTKTPSRAAIPDETRI